MKMSAQRTYVFAAVAAAGILGLCAGCATAPAPRADIPKQEDLQFTKSITATVTADQKIVMDGQKFKIADIPTQLAKRKASREITIIVYPESKMTRETLVELIQTLVQNKYWIVIDKSSKYADVPIPNPA